MEETRSLNRHNSVTQLGRGSRKDTSNPRIQRMQHVMKLFHRTMPGKSILVFTDKADVRKSIMRALLSAATEVALCFVRTTAELWQRLQDPKEQHHALLLDLSKNELQIEGLLRIVRQH